MKPPNSFVISEFTNPSGEIVFRVSGWLDGKRIRKNVGSRAEAKAEIDALEIQRVQGETGVSPTVTRLTEEELHEAEAVVRTIPQDFALLNQRKFECFLADAATCDEIRQQVAEVIAPLLRA